MTSEYKQMSIAVGADYLGLMEKWFKDGWDLSASTTIVREGQQYILFFLKRERQRADNGTPRIQSSEDTLANLTGSYVRDV